MQQRRPPKKTPSAAMQKRMAFLSTESDAGLAHMRKTLRERIDRDTKELAAVKAVQYLRQSGKV